MTNVNGSTSWIGLFRFYEFVTQGKKIKRGGWGALACCSLLSHTILV